MIFGIRKEKIAAQCEIDTVHTRGMKNEQNYKEHAAFLSGGDYSDLFSYRQWHFSLQWSSVIESSLKNI